MKTLTHVTHRIPWLAAALALALVCAPSRDSRADDDESKRKELMGRIEDKLEDAADAMEDVATDSSTRSIDRVRDLVSEARRSAEELARVAGDDRDAKRLAEDFDDHADDLFASLVALRALKQDENYAVPIAAMCADRDKELVRLAREYESKNDPDGLTELPKEAARVQETTKRSIDDAHRTDDKMEDLADDADDFSADGQWRALDQAEDQAAKRIYEASHKGEEIAERACESLMKGVDHPVVREVLSALGSSAGGRKAIIDDLVKTTRELASTLGSIAGDSGMSYVDRAKTHVGDLGRGVDGLGRISTTDKETKRIVDKWPAIIAEAREALVGIEELKQFQHVLDPLPDRCKTLEHDLDEFIAHNGDDSDGLDLIPSFAAGLGDPVEKGLVTAKERLNKMAAAQAKARQFTSDDGPWSDVRSAMTSSASTMYAYFEDKEEETVAACQYLRKGEDHPKVKAALDKLRAHSGSEIDVLTREVNQWVEKSKATYRLDCDAMQKLWAAYCSVDYEEGEDADDDPAQRVADDEQQEMRAAMEPLLRDLDDLRKRATALAKKKETKDRAIALGRDLDKEAERLQRLYPSGTWRGVNDPLKFYAAEFGKAAHRRKTSEFRCDVSDVTFDGLGRQRPDCIRASGCMIYEFKPDNQAAKDLGESQLNTYRPKVMAYYQKLIDSGDAPDSDRGGADILKAFEKAGCTRDKTLSLSTKVETYNMCEKKYWCVEN